MFHYTNEKGYKAISSQQTWLFKVSKPPGEHPMGAYFTTLAPGTRNLGKRLFSRGCSDKLKYTLAFSGGDDLKAIPGSRGKFIFYSEEDYPVVRERQQAHGLTAEVKEKFQ